MRRKHFVFIDLFCVQAYKPASPLPWHMCGGQRKTRVSQSSPSSMWKLGLKLKAVRHFVYTNPQIVRIYSLKVFNRYVGGCFAYMYGYVPYACLVPLEAGRGS